MLNIPGSVCLIVAHRVIAVFCLKQEVTSHAGKSTSQKGKEKTEKEKEKRQSVEYRQNFDTRRPRIWGRFCFSERS